MFGKQDGWHGELIPSMVLNVAPKIGQQLLLRPLYGIDFNVSLARNRIATNTVASLIAHMERIGRIELYAGHRDGQIFVLGQEGIKVILDQFRAMQ